MTVVDIEGYRQYLAERNGEADLLNRRLAHREEFFAKIEANPIRSRRSIDAQAFERGMRTRRPSPDIPPELALPAGDRQTQPGGAFWRRPRRDLWEEQQR